ncbi:MAG: PDZ domain-containing protein, partial [Gammaproteobacteria bacterium]
IMAQLYLRDRAQREGWRGNERYNSEMAALPGNLANLRAQMDEETYSRYLYALGRPNQVTVRRVLAGSEAEAAGLQDGDVLVRIDGQRVYAPNEVRRASIGEDQSNTVSVEVSRDGRRIQAYIPRGPFGITMGSDSVLPGDPDTGP